MSAPSLRIATRTSPLALWQAEYLADRLRQTQAAPAVELVPVETRGDGNRVSPLREFGGTGAFTREVQRAVLDNEADVAVHSLKDLPTDSIDGLCLACVPERAAREDSLLLPDGAAELASLAELPEGSRVGTGSPRRQAQLLHERPDLQMLEIRGNVDTRLRKLDDGEYDAIVLAAAGLTRLGLQARISLQLAPPRMFPAVGQGALGIECRADDAVTRELLAAITDDAALQAVTAERSLLRELRAGCHAPVGAWTESSGSQLTLTGVLLSLDGQTRLEASSSGPAESSAETGLEVARQLLEAGGEELVR